MLIRCEREKFAHAFQLAASVAAVRDVKPVLQNVKLKVLKNQAMLMATDNEMAVRIPIAGVEISAVGEAILPTKQMRRILSESRVATIELKTEKDKLHVSGDNFKFKLDSQDASDFPEVEAFAATSYHTLSSKVAREIIKRTSYAVDMESTRYMLGGVLLDMQEGMIDAVATDGRRLAFQNVVAQSVEGHITEKSSIFPPKLLQLVEKACSGEDFEMKIAVEDTRAIFDMDGTVLSARLIEGRFPRWKNIIPDVDMKDVAPIEMMAGALLSSVRQASIVTSDKSPGVHFTFFAGQLRLTGQGAEIGESAVELPIAYNGPELTTKLDPKYIEEFLRTLSAETLVSVYVDLAGKDPVLFRTEDKYTYVVMPMS